MATIYNYSDTVVEIDEQPYQRGSIKVATDREKGTVRLQDIYGLILECHYSQMSDAEDGYVYQSFTELQEAIMDKCFPKPARGIPTPGLGEVLAKSNNATDGLTLRTSAGHTVSVNKNPGELRITEPYNDCALEISANTINFSDNNGTPHFTVAGRPFMFNAAGGGVIAKAGFDIHTSASYPIQVADNSTIFFADTSSNDVNFTLPDLAAKTVNPVGGGILPTTTYLFKIVAGDNKMIISALGADLLEGAVGSPVSIDSLGAVIEVVSSYLGWHVIRFQNGPIIS